MRQVSDKISRFALGWAYVFIFVFLLSNMFWKEGPVLLSALFALGMYGIVFAAFSKRITGWFFIGLILTVCFGIMFLYFSKRYEVKYIKDMVNGIADLGILLYYNYDQSYSNWLVKQYGMPLLTVISLITSFLVYLFFNRLFNFFVITLLSAGVLAGCWFFTGRENIWAFGWLCTLTLLSYFRFIYERKKKRGLAVESLPLGNLMMATLPLAALLVIFTLAIPKNSTPIQWPWMDQKMANMFTFFEQRFTYTNTEFFKLSGTGFSNGSQRLGGSVYPSQTLVMDVTGSKRTYLRGAAYPYYTGEAWLGSHLMAENGSLTQSPNPYPFDPELYDVSEYDEMKNGWRYIPVNEKLFPDISEDSRELLAALADGSMNSILFPSYKLDIRYRNIATKTVFLPSNTRLPVKDPSGSPMTMLFNEEGMAYVEDGLLRNTSYSVDYLQPMYGDPMLQEALKYSRDGLYASAAYLYLQNSQNLEQTEQEYWNGDFFQTARSVIGKNLWPEFRYINKKNLLIDMNLDSATMEGNAKELIKLAWHAEQIREKYTQISPTMTKRTMSLAWDVTQGCENDYEKVKAIEKYLSSTFTYTTEVGYPPMGQDFVDWFLFDAKQGYCTFFASAMTNMVRLMGIPARYVEGYVMPQQYDSNNVYSVTNASAHAWVEVYFEGFGWLTFEPTSLYTGVMGYISPSAPVDVTAFFDDSEALDDILNMYLTPQNPMDYPMPDVGVGSGDSSSINVGTVLLALLGIVAAVYIVSQFAGILQGLRIKATKRSKRAIKTYELMLRWLEGAGYSIRPGETAQEYGKRIDNSLYLDGVTLSEASRLFSKVRYGGVPLHIVEEEVMEDTAKRLKTALLKDMGIRRFIPFRFFVFGL